MSGTMSFGPATLPPPPHGERLAAAPSPLEDKNKVVRRHLQQLEPPQPRAVRHRRDVAHVAVAPLWVPGSERRVERRVALGRGLAVHAEGAVHKEEAPGLEEAPGAWE